MADSDRSQPPERPRSTLQPQQSAIRLRRPSATARTSSRPAAPAASSDATSQRPPPPRSRAATTSVHDALGTTGETAARRLGSHQIREPSVLTPIAAEEPRESQAEEEGTQESGGGDEKRRRRGILSRLRWRSDTNLHASAQAGESGARGANRSSVDEHEYDDQIVNLLDAIDPEVTTLSSITNIQNSLYAPPLGRFINRRPTYNLTRLPQPPGAIPPGTPDDVSTAGGPGQTDELEGSTLPSQEEPAPTAGPSVERIPSNMTDSFFAVRPHGISFADWPDEDLAELNDHVRHMLHSRQSAMHRRLKAFGQYVRRPLGFLITLYATLITLFGLAWVLFLIGWIYVGEKQLYIINIIDNVLVALFAIVGDGMIPWRLVDTYHMAHIARYHRLSWKLRGKMGVPRLRDKNDLPSQTVQPNQPNQPNEPNEPGQTGVDLEAALNNAEKEVSVLTPKQQARLEHHQQRFAKSHTFYKPHETETHYAFPLRFLITIVCLLDLHSCLQLALGLCTWCIDYHVRPGALTATILSCSITVNATAGIFIMIGDRRTRKKEVVERMFRQDLTREAMRRVQKHQKEKVRKEEKKSRRSMAAEKEGADSEGRASFTRYKRSLDKGALSPEGRHSSSRFRKSMEKGGSEGEGLANSSRFGRSSEYTSRHPSKSQE